MDGEGDARLSGPDDPGKRTSSDDQFPGHAGCFREVEGGRGGMELEVVVMHPSVVIALVDDAMSDEQLASV
jgi:hypothetical protein